MNLWDPQAGLTLAAALGTAFLLGLLHGITPDEHTWPITFSYSIGGYSTRRGLIAGLTFSLSFTLQRALASELAYLSLGRWLLGKASVDDAIYVLVGLAMVWGGWHMMRGRHFHLFGVHALPAEATGGEWRDPRPWMPAVHGFIAGWGFGAFALIIYTVLAPQMPSVWTGWLPGALFGVGTTCVQAAVGAIFGWIAGRLHLPPAGVRQVALATAGQTLTWGGILFSAAGLFGLAFPAVAGRQVATGIRVHNLAHLGLPMLLVMGTVLGVGVVTLVRQTRRSLRTAAALTLRE